VSSLCAIIDHAFLFYFHTRSIVAVGLVHRQERKNARIYMCRVGPAKGFAEELVGGPCLFAGTRGSSSCYKMCRWSGRMSFGAPRMAAARLALEWLAVCFIDRFSRGV